MTIYEKSVLREREESYRKGKAQGIAEGKANAMYSAALLLSQKNNLSFGSVLDILEVPEEEKPMYLDRYRNDGNA